MQNNHFCDANPSPSAKRCDALCGRASITYTTRGFLVCMLMQTLVVVTAVTNFWSIYALRVRTRTAKVTFLLRIFYTSLWDIQLTFDCSRI